MDHFPLGDRSITSSSSIWPRTHSFSISTKNNVNVLQSPDIQSGGGSLGERAEDMEDKMARIWGRAGRPGNHCINISGTGQELRTSVEN